MARIIYEPSQEHRVVCPHCLATIGFTIEDTFQSYVRGQEDGEGWIDADCLWNYIHCPNCGKTISVDSKLSADERIYLRKKYEDD